MNLTTANAKLSRVRIRQKGEKLYLRATLPAKDGSGVWKQQELKTGCPATDKGINVALGKAQKLESDLMLERFTWDDWTTGNKAIASQRNINDWIAEFEKAKWEARAKTANNEAIFKSDYLIAFNQLPLDQRLTPEILREYLLKTDPDTRVRERNWNAYSALAKFAGVELPPTWKQLKGRYQPGERRIPSEEEILMVWEGLNPGKWKWAYGMIAAYGIRNHELARLDLSQFPILGVTNDSKTGKRLVYPLHKDWPDRLDLANFDPPELNSDVNRINGHRVTREFARRKIPFTPYALRDSYALRSAKLGISPAIAAKWMGHSLTTHYKSYLRHFEQTDFDSVWEGLAEKPRQ